MVETPENGGAVVYNGYPGYGGMGMSYPVIPYAPYGGLGGGMGGFGMDGGYFLLYLVVATMMFGGGMGGFGFGGGMMLPWMLMGMGQNNANNTNNDVQRNFDQLATSSAISNLSTAVSSGFSNAETAEAARHSALVNMLYSGQISDLERSFAAQTSINSGICDLSKDLLKCCCDNAANTAALEATVLRENCQDRYELAQQTQTVLKAIGDGVQAIKDQLYQDKLDAKNEQIVGLQNQLNMAAFRESQADQNNYLQNALTALTQYIIGLYPPASRTTPTTPTSAAA